MSSRTRAQAPSSPSVPELARELAELVLYRAAGSAAAAAEQLLAKLDEQATPQSSPQPQEL